MNNEKRASGKSDSHSRGRQKGTLFNIVVRNPQRPRNDPLRVNLCEQKELVQARRAPIDPRNKKDRTQTGACNFSELLHQNVNACITSCPEFAASITILAGRSFFRNCRFLSAIALFATNENVAITMIA